MPRKPRDEEAGAIHHVFARGVDKRRIYRDERDRRAYLEILGTVVEEFSWLPLAYCLMDNHVHLLVETPRPNLGDGVCRLHGEYARLFNRRHGRRGHLFESRFGSKRIRDDAYLLTVVRYVANNPVEAKLCEAPGAWAWDSVHRALGGTTPAWLAHGRLLDYLGGIGGGDAADRFAELVSAP